MRTDNDTVSRKNRSITILPLFGATRPSFVGVMVVSGASDRLSVVAVWLQEEEGHQVHTGEPHHWTQRCGGLSDKKN